MKRISLAFIFVCFALSLTAQDNIKVKYKGAHPTISDFAWAFLTADEGDDECGDHPTYAVRDAMIQQRKGLPLEDGETLTIDDKNGYVEYRRVYDGADYVCVMEMCYWNEADGKHKLFAFNNLASMIDGKPVITETSSLLFYRYNNATKKMTYCAPPGFEVEYSGTYALPHTGKDITFTMWDDDGNKTVKILKWDGRKFKY